MTPVDLVLIGRNEGARLVAGLASVAGAARRVVYVDSGSTDGSVAAARDAGAEVVELDMRIPFTAARARNAGYEALAQKGPAPEFVQFVDGDCSLVPGWIDAARTALQDDPSLGLVTGWRREIHPGANIYHSLAEREWLQPAGPIRVCGGDMMVRAAAFEAIGGFDASLISSEDEDFCLRLAGAGWGLVRLPLDMTRHDIAMSRLSEWLRRALRAGHGFAEVGARHPDHYRRQLARIWVYAGMLPLVFLAGLFIGWWIPALVAGLYAVSLVRTARGLSCDGAKVGHPWSHALFFTLGKFPNLAGMILWRIRRLRGEAPRLIEYK